MEPEVFILLTFLFSFISPDCSDPNNYCSWQVWVTWSECTVPCGGGSRTRVRPLCCAPDSPSFFSCIEQCGLTDNDIMGGFSETNHECNTFCYNGGNYSYGRCRCPDAFYGMCCSYAYVNKVHIVEPKADELVTYEDTRVELICQTSVSRPTPLIIWYLNNGTDDNIDDTKATGHVTQTPVYGSDELSVVTGNLIFFVNRTMNGWQIYCEADYIQSPRLTLDILFPAFVEEFWEVLHNVTVGIIEVNESELVFFKCNVNSNPGSTIVLRKGPNELKRVRDVLEISYTIGEVTCHDSGVYTCEARNEYNKANEAAIERLELVVNCVPRLSPMHKTRLLYNATLNETVVLAVPVMAYPIPLYSEWLKQNGITWSEVRHARSLVTSSMSNLVTEYTLTITYIQSSDYGNYKLCVANELSDTCIYVSLEEKVSDNLVTKLSPLLPPSPPTNLSFVPEFAHDLTAMIKWTPGFDGGVEQQFIVMYRKENEQSWTEVHVNDTHEGALNTTLSEVVEKTRYIVRIFAENEFGNSTIVEIAFEMPGRQQVTYTHNYSLIPVDVIGWVFSILLFATSVVVTIIFLILKIRQRLKTRTFHIQRPPYSSTLRKETHLFKSL